MIQLRYNDEQQELARIAKSFAEQHCQVERLRALRDSNDPLQYTPAVWKQMAELGWYGVHIPEEYGGVELGFAELAIILEAVGAGLAPEPLISSLVLGGVTLLEGGSEAQKKEYLLGIADGSRIFTLAHQELAADFDRTLCTTTATQTDDGWQINGKKVHVMDGGNATDILVVARVEGDDRDRNGLGIFLVDGNADGVKRTALNRIDSRNAAHIEFNDVIASDVIGDADRAADLIDVVLDRATIALCAEALGAIQRAFDISIEYIKERVQFDVPIGSFQALQHRAAELFAEVELARSITLAAARAVDQEPARVGELSAAAKSTVSEVFLHVAREGIQFHGGVGVTDEYDIGLYLKRAHIVSATFGDPDWQRDRWATFRGY